MGRQGRRPSPIDPQRRLSNADSAAVLAGRVTLVVSIAGARDRLVHDPADGGRAPPALGAAAKAAIDLASRCRRSLGGEYGADVVVAQYVARTDDHGGPAFPTRYRPLCNYRYNEVDQAGKTKPQFYSYSNLSVNCIERRRNHHCSEDHVHSV